MILEEKLKKLEEECKQRETERVNLELELTEVKESLKKALAGGVTLGLAIEPRPGTSSPQVTPAAPRERDGGRFLRSLLLRRPQHRHRRDAAPMSISNTLLGCVLSSWTWNFHMSFTELVQRWWKHRVSLLSPLAQNLSVVSTVLISLEPRPHLMPVP